MSSQYSFSGHETFPLRLNWLSKAVNIVNKNGRIFHSDTAISEFGVGKNMVRSIKYWSLATEMIETIPNSAKSNSLRATELGLYLLDEGGVDPYCEDTATLWLLHWLLCRSPNQATLWHFIFGHWRGGGIDFRSIEPSLKKWLGDKGGKMPADSTLRRDLQCLITTYIARYRKGSHLENVVEFPLASLGLLYENRGMTYLREGQKFGLPPEIFAYAVLDYWDRNFYGAETLATQNIIMHSASPRQIFLVSEEQAFELVSRIEAFEKAPFRFDTTAGIHQFYRASGSTPNAMLERYYDRTMRTNI